MFSLAENLRIDPKIRSNFSKDRTLVRPMKNLSCQSYRSGNFLVHPQPVDELKSVFQGKFKNKNVQLGTPPEYLNLGGLRLRDVNNISIPRVNSNLFFKFLT
jgi:hypothetical protein